MAKFESLKIACGSARAAVKNIEKVDISLGRRSLVVEKKDLPGFLLFLLKKLFSGNPGRDR